jgi:hypothetical protein
MINQRSVQTLYLLRLWQAHSGERVVWRVSLEDVHTGERHGFAGLDRLRAFLEDQLGAGSVVAAESLAPSVEGSICPSDCRS